MLSTVLQSDLALQDNIPVAHKADNTELQVIQAACKQ